ncbi:MAG TPA: helix-turn-helix transcriptional regulator [Solirubrobacterales bacterium]
MEELGRRLREARLERNLSQAEVAEDAGIGRVTLQRMEAGESPSLINFVRVLRVLDLLDGLESLLPPPGPSPIDEVERRGRRRQRARSSRLTEIEASREGWRWGDEEAREDT